jgi:HlyD family secretion protein
MKRTITIILQNAGVIMGIIMVATACGKAYHQADAYGNFEANEVIVSAQSQGVLTFLDLKEGDLLEKNRVVGKIDSAVPCLKKEQLLAQNIVITAKFLNLQAQLKVQEEQRINLVREVNRLEKLLSEGAATQQQYDDILGKLKVLDSQTETIVSQKNIINGEKSILNAQLDEVSNLLDKCKIVSPIQGTVLEKYVEAGELVSPGKALFKLADIGEMELRVYVSGAQLPSIAIGDTVDVMIDTQAETLQTLKGVVCWISSQVEFTPKIIQTREERVNMVYAVKIRVNNDGRLKIGMPGEVVFTKTKKQATLNK